MATLVEILKTEHHKQLAWLDNQVQKNNTSIFLNPSLALKAFGELNTGLILDDLSIEAFVFRYLSESGQKKLITTLRVAETRRKNSSMKMLQVNLDHVSYGLLNKLAKDTGLTKTELINKMIRIAKFTKREEQLEINI